MTNKPKRIGTAAETAVVRFLRVNGWPSAERAALAGSSDVGDVTGVPGLCVEVKGGAAAERAEDADVARWLTETETERGNRRADVGVLVLKRKGKGAASAGGWWVYLPGWAFLYLAAAADNIAPPYRYAVAADHSREYSDTPPVRVTLAGAVSMLRRAGYGTPLTEGEAA